MLNTFIRGTATGGGGGGGGGVNGNDNGNGSTRHFKCHVIVVGFVKEPQYLRQ